MEYEYMVKTRGMSMWDSIEGLGEALQNSLNKEANAYNEIEWELWHVQVLSDSNMGNNGLVYVYRRPKR